MTLYLEGMALAAKDNFMMGGKSDPYFELVDVMDGSKMARSDVVKNTLDPVWQPLETEVKPGHKYRIVVWDYDGIGRCFDVSPCFAQRKCAFLHR
jgi:hypothetical protein